MSSSARREPLAQDVPSSAPAEAVSAGVIRPIRPDDVAGVHALICELAEYEREAEAVVATAADLDRALFAGADTPAGHPALYGLVVDIDGAVVGMALWFLNYSTWRGRHGIYLEDLYVTPDQRGKGLGRALLAALANICTTQGYRRLEWSVLDWNEPAIGFYRSLHAEPMAEWTVFRLTDDALTALAAEAPEAPEAPGNPSPGGDEEELTWVHE